MHRPFRTDRTQQTPLSIAVKSGIPQGKEVKRTLGWLELLPHKYMNWHLFC
jgi:hypothetical protein